MTKTCQFITAANGESFDRAQIPCAGLNEFRQTVIAGTRGAARVSALFGHRTEGEEGIELYAVLSDDLEGRLRIGRTRVSGESFPSLTPDCPQVHLFEREIAEQFGILPAGHPWLKPVRFVAQASRLPSSGFVVPALAGSHGKKHHKQPPKGGTTKPAQPAKAGTTNGAKPIIGVTDFYQVAGDEVHEVAVGPVHAGIIEPGHFRFQCHGEEVFHLEISLGYQHRGIERALVAGPAARRLHYMETAAGDTSVGHATAYCQIMESLGCCQVPARAEALRGIALELERMANHTGDLGALAGDVGFLPTAAYCGRLRGDFLNLTALVCGNRFGRGLVRPGGVGFDVDGLRAKELTDRLASTMGDLHSAVNLLWNTPSVMARFEATGSVSLDTCLELGLVGPAARACGAPRDVRKDHPTGVFRFVHVPISSWDGGDVSARAYVRWLEIQRSARFIQDQLQSLPAGPISARLAPAAPHRMAVALVEGWRGEICHVAITGADGRLLRYKIIDPSFHNWTGLAMALRGQQISDFPLCNKSFNLSYCGYDL